MHAERNSLEIGTDDVGSSRESSCGFLSCTAMSTSSLVERHSIPDHLGRTSFSLAQFVVIMLATENSFEFSLHHNESSRKSAHRFRMVFPVITRSFVRGKRIPDNIGGIRISLANVYVKMHSERNSLEIGTNVVGVAF
jgi:hypothetical protein